ncbi:uncharacterized protein RCC_02777 [Ramularia collo-cygni]|uniref:SUZ domain-containing protein n=1 Tax=Ramularia collo-cygni TaxID=112498 RepID=A0A2D3V954_9PEZI|nr:uncharacterized protein RCC_02777 [Ramularia collo-cygni]CZT16943.1 uncharacterized protein RCC_02777 [Ramularia collo-cygni]
MSKKGAAAGAVPDAWDDDWVKAADTPPAAQTTATTSGSAPKLSKAERRAQHLEQQKQLWDSAENPARFHWLETQGVVPLKQEFAPPVTVLSRKPPTIAKRTATDGLGQLSLEDDEDSEEEARKKREASMEERQRQAKIEREEKQRRYAEARERIMGSSNPSPTTNSRDSSQARDTRRRGGKAQGTRRSQPHSPAEPVGSYSPSASATPQLFDPEDMGRRLAHPGRDGNNTPKAEGKGEGPARQPRGPSGGGFGFGNRGGLT